MPLYVPHNERFIYKRNMQRLAEIDLYHYTDQEYSFTLHITPLAKVAEPYRKVKALDSKSLHLSFPQIKESYDNQKDCIRAARSLLSMMLIN